METGHNEGRRLTVFSGLSGGDGDEELELEASGLGGTWPGACGERWPAAPPPVGPPACARPGPPKSPLCCGGAEATEGGGAGWSQLGGKAAALSTGSR